ncbi:MAG: fructose-2,6-bisphosphatase [Neobacillus sp.]|jgi:phosphohistidine phosphatase SixA|nr:fructose-2,6-bisphosphatase [Neobacillus sp.]
MLRGRCLNGSLLNLLQAGGYILYVRHGEATVGEDLSNPDFKNCYTQRNLSEQGRRQAIYYGQNLRNLQIPISYPVQTSPFCRTIETAILALGRLNIQIDPFWFQVSRLSGNRTATEQQSILDSIQSRLEVIPPEGRNIVIIAHNFPTEIGLGEIPDMGTVIIRPRGQGKGYEVIAKLSLIDILNLERY